MDEAERIPIDLGYEAAAQDAGPSDSEVAITRSTTREDGTMVIDILAPPECSPEEEADIVVCANPAEGSAEPPPSETLADHIGEALHTKIGPLELGSIRQRDGTRRFGARIRF
jgi:hypothetical protein